MSYKRVAVLRGGPSTEYEISLETGKGVIESLKKQNFFVKDVVIDRQGEWIVDGYVKTPDRILSDIDVVFLALHGSYGEDGTVQRIIERLRVPYTGSGPMASAICFNKHITKEHLKEANFKLPRHIKVTRSGVSDIKKTAHSVNELIGSAYIVKPTTGGSSIDTVLVDRPLELTNALRSVLDKHEEVMVEERIVGREATVGILEDFRNEKYYLLPEVEIVPPETSKFFSAEVKYTGETNEIVPGRFTKDEKKSLADAARFIHTALNLQQYSRSDFIVNKDGIYFLEVNTLPGLTSQSLFPKSVAAVGSNYDELVSHLIETARV